MSYGKLQTVGIILKYCIPCFASILLCFIAGEIYLRFHTDFLVFNKLQSKYFRKADPIIHHTFIPCGRGPLKTKEFTTHYSINSFGLRDHEYQIPKGKGIFRILMLGDSFTEGYGVEIEDTFSKKVEAKIGFCKTEFGTKYEVVNGGCASYSPLLEYLFLKEQGLKLEPDVVILNYDMSDIKDDYYYSQIAEFDNYGIPLRVIPEKFSCSENKVNNYLERHSFFYLSVKERLSKSYWEKARIKYETQIGYVGDYSDRYVFTRENTEDWKELWLLSQRYLLLIDNLLKEKGIKFVICVYPYGHQVNGYEWSEGRKVFGFNEGEIYSTRAFPLMEEFCMKQNIPFINMLASFKECKKRPLFNKFDGHFTSMGHELMAELIAEYLLWYLFYE